MASINDALDTLNKAVSRLESSLQASSASNVEADVMQARLQALMAKQSDLESTLKDTHDALDRTITRLTNVLEC